MVSRVAAVAILALAAGAAAESAASAPVVARGGGVEGEKPWFCHDLDCPTYEVLDEDLGSSGIELRSYAAGVWVSTNVSDVGYDEAVGLGFMRLFRYISGANKDEQKIDMTAPVRVLLIPGEGPFCESHFTVSFYVPPELQASPPLPTDSSVFVQPSPAASYYVSSYSGFTSEKRLLEHAFSEMKQLEILGRDFDASVFYAAGYDSPFRLLGRHNEVWIPARVDAPAPSVL
mmetsp:Transcript_16420/g.48914  ORF Transcript_16420/g.48914 Transcript_16420/m.48914 type:complete len:231 (-) Transcript_16420:786-1478(-)